MTKSDAIKLAAEVARKTGIIPTWPNLQTIRLAIESEADFFQVSAADAAKMIVKAAREPTPIEMYRAPTEAERRSACRLNLVDRFWFEDARWRAKAAYEEFRAGLQQRASAHGD